MKSATKTWLAWSFLRQGGPFVFGAAAGVAAGLFLGRRGSAVARTSASRAAARTEPGTIRGVGGIRSSRKLDLTAERCAALETEAKVDWAAFIVDEAIDESFPASDPPSWTPTRSRPPRD